MKLTAELERELREYTSRCPDRDDPETLTHDMDALLEEIDRLRAALKSNDFESRMIERGRLVKLLEKRTDERDELQRQVNGWLSANGPDGWIGELRKQHAELLVALNLLYSWAHNWDSEFMNDPDWKNRDLLIVKEAIASVKGEKP